jgi:cytochrome oxidase assembly protein ShyY1
VLRVLTSRRWLGAFAAAAVFAVAAFFLGQWQWHRYEAKQERAERITSHYQAAPVPVRSVVGTDPMPLAQDWTRVTATGSYAVERTLVVRNRPLEGTYGYEVLVPLRLSDGSLLVVDRGWVPNAATAEELPEVPAAPTGVVSATGWLRPSEKSLGRELPAGQLASINLDEAGRQIGGDVLGAYLVLERERTADGASPARPTALERPDTDLGPHQAYAFQWWSAMIAGFVLVWFGARREYLEGKPASGAVAGQPKPKKVRIWDEEDA